MESTEAMLRRWNLTLEALVVEMERELLATVDDKGLAIHGSSGTKQLINKFVGTYNEVEQSIKEGV